MNSAAGGLPDRVVVSEDPADWTPHVLDGRIDTITRVGDRMVAGGRFSKVRQAGSSEVLTRKNLFAFDARTGAIDKSFNPAPEGGGVNALVAAPDGDAVFVGGQFRHIAGKAQTALAKLDVPSGRLSDGFRPSVKSRVDALAVHGSRLFFAGEITTVNGAKRWGLAAVDVNSGALEPGVAVKFSDPGNGVLTVNRFAIRPDGSRLVAMGSFLKADGKDRPRLAVLDLDGGKARLADWHTDGYAEPCSSDVRADLHPGRRHLGRRFLLRRGHHRRQGQGAVRLRGPLRARRHGRRHQAHLGGRQRRRQLHRPGRHRRRHLRRGPPAVDEQPLQQGHG